MNIYVEKDGRVNGPYTIDELVVLTRKGDCKLSDKAWHEGMTEWKPMHAMHELANRITPPLSFASSAQHTDTSLGNKSDQAPKNINLHSEKDRSSQKGGDELVVLNRKTSISQVDSAAQSKKTHANRTKKMPSANNTPYGWFALIGSAGLHNYPTLQGWLIFLGVLQLLYHYLISPFLSKRAEEPINEEEYAYCQRCCGSGSLTCPKCNGTNRTKYWISCCHGGKIPCPDCNGHGKLIKV
jgi:hypothetical protein